MKNIHVLKTDKPSELYINIQGVLSKSNSLLLRLKSRHIYITSSDEEIKDGDWCMITPFGADKFAKVIRFNKENGTIYNLECKKIILTTDQDLIADGVWGIEDGFLEWFVKNPTCEYVELKGYAIILPGESCDCDNKCDTCKEEEPKQDLPIVKGSYGCIIQTKKQEHKQETLEEFTENYLNKFYSNYAFKDLLKPLLIDGAKWQQERMYSEEEVRKAIKLYSHIDNELSIGEILQQFKKK